MTQLTKVAAWEGATRLNVVFVHGLGGHAYDTWRSAPDIQSFWPDWLSRDVPGVSAWTLAYDAPPSNWFGTGMPIQDRATNVLECLLGVRELRGTPLVFVCHSLGGLIVKQLLRAADARRGYGDKEATALIGSVKGVVFIATPHTGSAHATLLDTLRLIVWPSPSTLDLVKNNANLRDLNVWYRNWSTSIQHKVFYEKRSTPVGVVVGDDSSDPGLLHVQPIGVDADHRTICKPVDANDLVYARTRDFLAGNILTDRGPHDDGAKRLQFDLPPLSRSRSIQVLPIAVRLAVLAVFALVVFKGVQALLFPRNLLNAASVEQIEDALRIKSANLTPLQIEQFIRSLREARGDPSFERAVEEAKKGNTRVAEGIWRQIYDNRDTDQNRAQLDKAKAALNLAAVAITNDTAQGLSWFRKATELNPGSIAGWCGLGSAAQQGGTTQEAEQAYRKCIELARSTGDSESAMWGLIGLGDVQFARGDIEGSLKSYNDSLDIADRLAKSDPRNTGLQLALSAASDRIGEVQEAKGDLAGAFKSYSDSLAVRDRLVKSDPGNVEWQHALSVSYEKLGNLQAAQGHLSSALKSFNDSLAIRDRLAKLAPDNKSLLRDFEISFERVGDAQREWGDPAGALESFNADFAIADRLAKSDPGNLDWQRDLSRSYEKVGDARLAQGDLSGALKSYGDCLTIRDRLARSDLGHASWQSNLSMSYEKIGDVQAEQGDLLGAIKSYSESLTIRDRLAKSAPENADWQRDLSMSHQSIGDVLAKQGDLPGALKSYSDSLAIADRLAKSDPGIARWQRDLSISYDRIGDAKMAQGEMSDALKSYSDSLAIADRLTKSDPGNPRWQGDLAISYDRIGDVKKAQNDLAGALRSYSDSLAIRDRLAKSAPDNIVWQYDLSASYDKVGDVRLAQRDFAGALKSYRDSLATRDRLAKSNPGNAVWQRDLAVSYEEVGNVQVLQYDDAGALKSHRDSLAIRDRLAKSNPENAGWQRDLAISYEAVGDLQDDPADALKSYRESLAIRERLARSNPENAGRQRDVATSNERLGKAFTERGQTGEAVAAYESALRTYRTLLARNPDDIQSRLSLVEPLWRLGELRGKDGRPDLESALAILTQLAAANRLDAEQQDWIADIKKLIDELPK